MKQINGDLVELALAGEYEVIVQGCNCMCQMGKGIALTIKNTWPEAYAADCATTKGDASKLGTITTATVDVNGKPLTIVNAYSQYKYGKGGVYSSVEAIYCAMTKVKELYSGKKIAMPKIGCGLAGGDWDQVGPAIELALAGEDLTIVTMPTTDY